MAYTPDRRMITSVDGTKIYAEALGDKTNVPVVFVHGFCCDLTHFEKQFKANGELVQSVFIIRYDVRGHGRSGSPMEVEAYESLRHAQDLKAVLDAFGVEKPFVAGWSLGGFLPADFASAYTPSSLRGVILLSSSLGPHGDFLTRVTRPHMASVLGQLLTNDLQVLRKAALDFVKRGLYAESFERTWEEERSVLGGLIMMDPTVQRHSLVRLPTPGPLLAAVQKGEIPVLVIQGKEDACVDAELVRSYMTENGVKFGRDEDDTRSVHEFHVIEGVGHSPFYEAPETVDRLILNFVRKIERA